MNISVILDHLRLFLMHLDVNLKAPLSLSIQHCPLALEKFYKVMLKIKPASVAQLDKRQAFSSQTRDLVFVHFQKSAQLFFWQNVV